MTDMVALDFSIEQVSDDWEELTSAGREVMQHMDTGRWLAGDLANRCAVRYGETSLTKYAADIGVARAGTLREYARVSKFYDHATRVAFREGGLSWSHFRECMRAGDDAPVWLTVAADNNLPVAELARQLRAAIGAPVPPRKLWEGEGKFDLERIGASDYTGDPGHLEYIIILNADDMQIELEQRVRVVVYAVDKEAE